MFQRSARPMAPSTRSVVARFGACSVALLSTLALAGCAGSPGATSSPSAPATSSPAPSASPATSPSAEPSASAGEVQELAVTGTDFAFEAPATIPAGPTKITLTNEGQEEHQAQLAGIAAGNTFEDLTAALQANDEAAALGMLELAGGPTGVVPGASGSTTSNLEPGLYAFLCFVRSADGVPHFAKGMIAPIEVTEPASTGTLPTGDAELELQDFAFVGLETLSAGPQTITVTNNGPQPHEATIVELAEGIDAAALVAMLNATEPPSGPPPFTSAGGVAGIAPGETVTMDVDLEPGDYAFICFVPDPASGKPHAALGMVGPLTVE